MDNFINQLQIAIAQMQLHLPLVLGCIALLYAIFFVNALSHHALNVFGNYPRTWHGLFGIFCAPLLHGNFNHLFFNSIPLFILMNFILIYGQSLFLQVTLFIITTSGVLVWLLGRKALHIGASGLIMGYWSYLLASTWQHPNVISIALAIICLYYLGGLALEIVPIRQKTSWEYHLAGFIAGILANFILPMLQGVS